jgi:hypothetical protein
MDGACVKIGHIAVHRVCLYSASELASCPVAEPVVCQILSWSSEQNRTEQSNKTRSGSDGARARARDRLKARVQMLQYHLSDGWHLTDSSRG